MIKKLRICKGCGKDKLIFSKGLCNFCFGRLYNKPLKSNKKVKKVSETQLQRLAKYKLLREEYLLSHQNCEICGNLASEIHHKNGRIGDNLFKDFLAICRICHTDLHNGKSNEN